MAFNPAPSALFPSWAEDGTTITVPLASITDLTAVEADGTTGDWRAIMLRIMDHVWAYSQGLATADKPTKLLITRQRRESGTNIINSYRIDVTTNTDETSMASE